MTLMFKLVMVVAQLAISIMGIIASILLCLQDATFGVGMERSLPPKPAMTGIILTELDVETTAKALFLAIPAQPAQPQHLPFVHKRVETAFDLKPKPAMTAILQMGMAALALAR